MSTLALLLAVCLVIPSSTLPRRAEDLVDCSQGCLESKCHANIGCNTCGNGYCLNYETNGVTDVGVCHRTCPSGKFCQEIFMSLCKPCKDANCMQCDNGGVCTKCKPSFTLVSSDSSCTQEVTTVPATTVEQLISSSNPVDGIVSIEFITSTTDGHTHPTGHAGAVGK